MAHQFLIWKTFKRSKSKTKHPEREISRSRERLRKHFASFKWVTRGKGSRPRKKNPSGKAESFRSFNRVQSARIRSEESPAAKAPTKRQLSGKRIEEKKSMERLPQLTFFQTLLLKSIKITDRDQ